MKKECPKYISVIFGICSAIIVVCVILLITHTVSFEFYGFGVDSDNNLYIGWGNKIEVYSDGERIRTIKNGTSKGHFNFTVQEDDTILLSVGSDVMVMDIVGLEIRKKWNEADEKTDKMLEENKFEFKSLDGDMYTATYLLGRATIYKNGNAIYKTPFIDCIVVYLLAIGVPTLIIFRLIFKRKYKRFRYKGSDIKCEDVYFKLIREDGMKKSCHQYIKIIFFIFFAIACISGFLISTEQSSFIFYGFGVDFDERLYVGWGNKIDVYKDGEKIHTIRKVANEGFYNFTIQDGNKILLTHDSDVIVMDLMGNKILKSWTEENKETSKLLKRSKHEFHTSEGEIYTASYFMGMLTIYKDGAVVHRSPVFELIITYAFFITLIGTFIVRFILRRKYEDFKQ